MLVFFVCVLVFLDPREVSLTNTHTMCTIIINGWDVKLYVGEGREYLADSLLHRKGEIIAAINAKYEKEMWKRYWSGHCEKHRSSDRPRCRGEIDPEVHLTILEWNEQSKQVTLLTHLYAESTGRQYCREHCGKLKILLSWINTKVPSIAKCGSFRGRQTNTRAKHDTSSATN